MKQIIALGGEPATGKTSIVKGIIARLGGAISFQDFKYGLVRGHWNAKENLMIIGIYDEKTFAGTDRLSMAVINDAVKYLGLLKSEKKFENTCLIFEGDRLFNNRFLTECQKTAPTAIVFLEVSEEQKHKRHEKRGDTQTGTWLQGRKTKVANLITQFPDAQIYKNENEIDQSRIVHSIFALLARKTFAS